jgi:hypothetical protein
VILEVCMSGLPAVPHQPTVATAPRAASDTTALADGAPDGESGTPLTQGAQISLPTEDAETPVVYAEVRVVRAADYSASSIQSLWVDHGSCIPIPDWMLGV